MTGKPQRQDALSDQLRDLIGLATREGMYDAADWIQARLPQPQSPDQRLRSMGQWVGCRDMPKTEAWHAAVPPWENSE